MSESVPGSSVGESLSSSPRTLVIGTRDSQLAKWQAYFTRDKLSEKGLKSEVKGMKTTGDTNLSIPLSHFSDKGVFTKELDRALLNGSVDCAVHCIKDLMTTLPDGLDLGCFLARGPKHDCVILSLDSPFFSMEENSGNFHLYHQFSQQQCSNLLNLLKHAQMMSGVLKRPLKLGTSSLRRIAFLNAVVKRVNQNGMMIGNNENTSNVLCLESIRGNLNTRLRKLKDGLYDGIVLAKIGVNRLGWNTAEFLAENRLVIVDLSVTLIPYAVGQGGLGVAIRTDEAFDLLSKVDTSSSMSAGLPHSSVSLRRLFLPLFDGLALLTCAAERAMLRVLEGGCKVPVAVSCDVYFRNPYTDFCTPIAICDDKGEHLNKDLICQASFQSLKGDPNESLVVYSLNLRGYVSTEDGSRIIQSIQHADFASDIAQEWVPILFREKPLTEEVSASMLLFAEELGISVAKELTLKGAKQIIDDIRQSIESKK